VKQAFRQLKKLLIPEKLFADRTGLEPATSAVTGRHSNQLNYRSLPRKQHLRLFSGRQR
jgi:hypothetical protein